MIINQNFWKTLHQAKLHSCYYWIFRKVSNRKKISNEHFNLCEAEIFLDVIIKFINSETNNKSPCIDGLTAEFYKRFSNELTPLLLDIYDSWGKLSIMGVTCETEIICSIYKNSDKKDIANNRPISLLNLDYKIYTNDS